MAENSQARLAILISQYPAINHSIILNEIRELRRSFVLCTASIRASNRPAEQLTAAERDEASRTYYVKPGGIRAALFAVVRTSFLNPAGFVRGLLYALRLSVPRPKQAFKNFAYFLEALVVGQWMRREAVSHLHTHYSSTVGLLAKRVFPVELSITFHGPDEFNDPKGFWLKQKVEASTFVRGISHYSRSQLMLHCRTGQWEKIEVAHMGVDPNMFSPRPFREDPSPVEIICVGRLVSVKAQRILISAVGKLVQDRRNVLLHIVGGGPDRPDLEKQVDSLGIRPHVVFHGFASHDKVKQLYGRSDVFAISSFAEGLPAVLMEAMAMEIPCVSTWIMGVPELIRDGIDGLLVPPSDVLALALAISRLMDDPELRRRIGVAGRQRVIEEFHLQKNARYFASIFERRVFSQQFASGRESSSS